MPRIRASKGSLDQYFEQSHLLAVRFSYFNFNPDKRNDEVSNLFRHEFASYSCAVKAEAFLMEHIQKLCQFSVKNGV